MTAHLESERNLLCVNISQRCHVNITPQHVTCDKCVSTKQIWCNNLAAPHFSECNLFAKWIDFGCNLSGHLHVYSFRGTD
jgi:hypothetical protein